MGKARIKISYYYIMFPVMYFKWKHGDKIDHIEFPHDALSVTWSATWEKFEHCYWSEYEALSQVILSIECYCIYTLEFLLLLYMKSFIAKWVISILVNFWYLRFKLLKYKENNKKICDTSDFIFHFILFYFNTGNQL